MKLFFSRPNRTQMCADYQDFKYKKLTEKIIKIFYKVYNKLGDGFLEKVYGNAMMIEFRKEKIPAISQSPETVGEYFADILVDKKVIVEIKVARYLVEDNEARY